MALTKNNTIELTSEGVRITDQAVIKKAQEAYGKRWQTKLAETATAALRAALGMTADVGPREAAVILGVSKATVLRRVTAGAYPNSYMVNSRVIRIPLKDL
jgi:hypothetical protein